MRTATIVSLSLGMLLSLSCRSVETDGTAGPSESPGLTARMYVLRSIAGERLPAVLLDNEYVTIISLADTLWLAPEGSGREIATERSLDKGSTEGPIVRRDERPFAYGTSRNRIEIAFECNDVIIRSCSAPPHLKGVLTETGLVLEHALYDKGPLVYERIQ
ncbi:MAG TPA: hypothetical protein VJ808_05970 [Gemmatimonadales bacterium]|nr:hypothetical protein [Gemmatimonadales bacterium]